MTVKKITPTQAPPSLSAHSTAATGRVFIGRLQPSSSRAPGKPPVDYSKGGDDFRCPKNAATTSSFGRQCLGFRHTNTAPVVRFAEGARFDKQETVGVGPNSFGQMSSMGRQVVSHRRAAGATTFGTSTRAGALKLYAIYTCKKN